MTVTFPIEDFFRLPLLILEWIFAFLSLEIGLILIIKYRRQESQLRTSQELGYASFFIGLSLMWIFTIFADFFSSAILTSPFYIWSQGSERNLLLSLSSISMMIGTSLFFLLIKKDKKSTIWRYVVPIFLVGLMLASLISSLINLEFVKLFSIVFWFGFFIFSTFYFIQFSRNIIKTENFLLELIKFLPPFVLLTAGFIQSTDYIVQAFGLELRLLGSTLQLISICFLFFIFLRMPPFSEYEWQDKIDELLIMNRAGICLYHTNFVDRIDTRSEVLMSGALLSINIVLEEITSATREGTSTIKKKGKTVNLFSTPLLTGVLISQEELNSIKYYLKEFIQKVEKIYYNVLQDWDGDVSIFSPVEGIVDEFFSSKS